MTAQASVLVVDGQEETSEVLRTVLARRGVEVLATRRADQGLRLVRRHSPDVIVLDVETAEGPGALATYCDQAQSGAATLILVGTTRRGLPLESGAEFVRKPYQFGPLVRKIEALLAHVRAPIVKAA